MTVFQVSTVLYGQALIIQRKRLGQESKQLPKVAGVSVIQRFTPIERTVVRSGTEDNFIFLFFITSSYIPVKFNEIIARLLVILEKSFWRKV